ncbi:MAG: hypothetical protein C4583_19220 [Anaerolineaceae bacterium]|nr:MAG: hypothetical protein C4583_19220 [Anaerolineaceae bacterium]
MLETILVSIIIAFLTTLVTATFAYFGYWRQAAAELKKDLANRFNEQKWKAYQEFMIMQSRSTNIMRPESAEIRIALLLTASDDVIEAFNEYISLSFQKDKVEERHHKIGAMIAAMRRDLGCDTKLTHEDLWKIFNSISEL